MGYPNAAVVLATSVLERQIQGELDVGCDINLDGFGRLMMCFATGGARLHWDSRYSRIVDDGDLRIATDDNLHFNTWCSSWNGENGKANGNFGIITDNQKALWSLLNFYPTLLRPAVPCLNFVPRKLHFGWSALPCARFLRELKGNCVSFW